MFKDLVFPQQHGRLKVQLRYDHLAWELQGQVRQAPKPRPPGKQVRLAPQGQDPWEAGQAGPQAQDPWEAGQATKLRESASRNNKAMR